MTAYFIKRLSVSRVKEYFLDTPNHRKMHQRLVPRMGGFVIILALLCALPILNQIATISLNMNYAILSVLLCVLIVGVLDDSVVVQRFRLKKYGPKHADWGLRPKYKLLLEFILAGAAIALFWIVGVMNALNIIDGLAVGTSSIILAIIGGMGLYFNLPNVALVVFLAVAANLAFWVINVSPANVFYGDAGSLLQGALIGALSLCLFNEPSISGKGLAMCFIVGYPIAEVLISMLRRAYIQAPKGTPFKSRLKRMLAADNNHVHHRLLKVIRG